MDFDALSDLLSEKRQKAPRQSMFRKNRTTFSLF
jgi:hypothetical protein